MLEPACYTCHAAYLMQLCEACLIEGCRLHMVRSDSPPVASRSACNGHVVNHVSTGRVLKRLTIVLQELCQAEGVGIGQCDTCVAEQPIFRAEVLSNKLQWCKSYQNLHTSNALDGCKKTGIAKGNQAMQSFADHGLRSHCAMQEYAVVLAQGMLK